MIKYRLLNELRKKHERDENYAKAKSVKKRFDELSSVE